MPGPESDYNLAKETPVFSPAWSQALFDLRQFEAGHCFTYDPPAESESGINNGLYIIMIKMYFIIIIIRSVHPAGPRESGQTLHKGDKVCPRLFLHDLQLQYLPP